MGLYADDPARTLLALKRSASGITVISAYLTAGKAVPASLIAAANRDDAELLVTWEPDGGSDGPDQPAHRLTAVIHGSYDASLRTLVAQLRQVRAGAILRPMPEMNTPWHAWSGTANGNSPSRFVSAWRHVRRVVDSTAGGSHIQMLWSPYAWSIPDDSANKIAAYFPGRSEVDLVGVDGYNFGNRGNVTWTDPGSIFGTAYSQIESLADKPFWIAETGSTADGGDKAGWILSLSTLQSTVDAEAGGAGLVRRRRSDRRLPSARKHRDECVPRSRAGGVPMSKSATKPEIQRGGRITAETVMTTAMVDRLFWRAGFGPGDGRPRDAGPARPLAAAVDWLLGTPAGYSGSPGTDQRQPARPDRQRHGPRAQLGRPDGPRDQPVRRAADVLLAPALGQLARIRSPRPSC